MPLRYILLAVLVMALWGCNFVAIKVGLQNIPPFLFSALRFTFTVFPIIFFIGKRDAPWAIIISVGLALGTFKFSSLFVGMDLGVSAGIASLVLQVQVFFTVALAIILLGEKAGVMDVSGMAVAFLGVALIALEMPGMASLYGLALAILAGFFWAVSNLIMKQAGKVNMLRLIVYMSLIPIIPLFTMSYLVEGPEKIQYALEQMNLNSVLALGYIVFVGTVFGFAVWGFLLSKYPAAKVAPFSLLVPIFGMSSSALLLGETFSTTQITGALLVMAGLILINSKSLLEAGRNKIRSVRPVS